MFVFFTKEAFSKRSFYYALLIYNSLRYAHKKSEAFASLSSFWNKLR